MNTYPEQHEWLMDNGLWQSTIDRAKQWTDLCDLLGLDAAATAEGVTTEVKRLREDLAKWRDLNPPKITTGLSDRQVRILSFIREYLDEHSYPPTIREICKATDTSSTSVVKYNLERLEAKGCITRGCRLSRSIRLLQPEDNSHD